MVSVIPLYFQCVAILAPPAHSISVNKLSSVWPIPLWPGVISPWWMLVFQLGIRKASAPRSSSMPTHLIIKSCWRRLSCGWYHPSRYLISLTIVLPSLLSLLLLPIVVFFFALEHWLVLANIAGLRPGTDCYHLYHHSLVFWFTIWDLYQIYQNHHIGIKLSVIWDLYQTSFSSIILYYL